MSEDLLAVLGLHLVTGVLVWVTTLDVVRGVVGVLFVSVAKFNVGDLLTNHLRAVVLVVGFALRALHARLYLSTNTNTVSSLELLDLGSDSQDLADDLVADADGLCGELSPSTCNGVDIGAADTATLVLNVNIVVLEDLGRELRSSARFEDWMSDCNSIQR